jgi:Mg2+ and Co2+ transporter CorA
MDAVVDRYFPIINSLEKEFEAFEQMVFEAQKSDGTDKVELMKKLYHFKSKTRICATLDSLMDSVNSTIQIAIALVSIEES